MPLIFVDCEAFGPCPSMGRLTEFGAIEFKSRQTFHGKILESSPDPTNPARALALYIENREYRSIADLVFHHFDQWLSQFKGRPIFVSDNPAYDFQWINDGFWLSLNRNPFGHSGRRISDFYAGLCNDFYKTQDWKKYRVTPHDHNPVNDAMGNVEAFESLLAGKR